MARAGTDANWIKIKDDLLLEILEILALNSLLLDLETNAEYNDCIKVLLNAIHNKIDLTKSEKRTLYCMIKTDTIDKAVEKYPSFRGSNIETDTILQYASRVRAKAIKQISTNSMIKRHIKSKLKEIQVKSKLKKIQDHDSRKTSQK